MIFSGDIIVHVGDMSRDLYIVRRGQAEILSADRSCVVATCGPGGYFGEVSTNNCCQNYLKHLTKINEFLEGKSTWALVSPLLSSIMNTFLHLRLNGWFLECEIFIQP